MKNKLIDVKYVMRPMEINKDNIHKFWVNEEERRKLRVGKMKSILAGLSRGNHFRTPFIVNEKSDKLRIIDGNHRFEAIKEMLSRDENFCIRVWLATYKNMDRSKERKEYHINNIGTPENATDFLQQHFKTLPFNKEMLSLLPASLYGTAKQMKIKDLMGNHLLAKKGNKFLGGYSFGGERTVADFKTVTMEDVKTVKAWYLDMKEIFGDYIKGSPYYRTTPASVFYRIWYDNRNINRSKFIKAFRKTVLDRWSLYNEETKHGGMSASASFYRHLLSDLQDKNRRLEFKSDLDLIEERKNGK